ncbi:MAG: MBL fold metallo-hydrolase [Desulfitobacteriaceae bacterium]|nr:MBL fold metallo-hydrolase [Desulfitobacteriaceae bacterium]MDI6915199.1 MBL fold metallo-hydrolase [Desulfitobacteriaceae bacterium]
MLQKVNGQTYYCPGPTNIGVVRYKNGMALLVDAGIDSTAGRGLAQALEAEGLKPKYLILTHAHPDHFGAAKWLKEQYTGLLRYASGEEAMYMKYHRLESEALYGASPLRELEGRFLKGPAIEVENFLKPGVVELGEKRFQIIALPGHTFHQIGVLTGDGVLFAGDSLFSEAIMEKYAFPFLLDVEAELQTLKNLEELEVQAVVLSHGKEPYSSIKELCAKNRERIEEYLEMIGDGCNQPLTREDVTEQILLAAGTEADIPGYHMAFATAGAFLSYLANRHELEKSIVGGKCYFYKE